MMTANVISPRGVDSVSDFQREWEWLHVHRNVPGWKDRIEEMKREAVEFVLSASADEGEGVSDE